MALDDRAAPHPVVQRGPSGSGQRKDGGDSRRARARSRADDLPGTHSSRVGERATRRCCALDHPTRDARRSRISSRIFAGIVSRAPSSVRRAPRRLARQRMAIITAAACAAERVVLRQPPRRVRMPTIAAARSPVRAASGHPRNLDPSLSGGDGEHRFAGHRSGSHRDLASGRRTAASLVVAREESRPLRGCDVDYAPARRTSCMMLSALTDSRSRLANEATVCLCHSHDTRSYGAHDAAARQKLRLEIDHFEEGAHVERGL